jgi:exo-beta-1,3-glucanase (GH17 family)
MLKLCRDQNAQRHFISSAMLVIILLACFFLTGCGQSATPVNQTISPTPLQTAPPQTASPQTAPPQTSNNAFADPSAILKVSRWVDYSPTGVDPDKGIEPTEASIRDDLKVLKSAGFTGLLTYSSTGIMGEKFPDIAKEMGFDGIIIGVWDPKNELELNAAKRAAGNSILLGYCVGNEGLEDRYSFLELSDAISRLRNETSKPVTTTEELDDYEHEALLTLGDWVFPNAHPFFQNIKDPEKAVAWTVKAYQKLTGKTGRTVIFKEVGLPTAGEPDGLSENNQADYYAGLMKENIHFFFFEAFDQEWKTKQPVEPYWGIFNSDRTPKHMAYRLMGIDVTSAPTPSPSPSAAPSGPASSSGDFFYVYKDSDYAINHFSPSGYMGYKEDVKINEVCSESPYSGSSCIKVTYKPAGDKSWSGVYWQQPPDNWGTSEKWKGKGYNLSKYGKLTFYARTEATCSIEFFVGGVGGAEHPYGDTLEDKRSILAELTNEWKMFTISMEYGNLSHIISGFGFATNAYDNPGGAVFYLDEIRYEN